jgi:hypothetical protein
VPHGPFPPSPPFRTVHAVGQAASEVPCSPFPTAPLQTARESFDLKQLSGDLGRNVALPWPFTVQCLAARATGDQGLAAIRYHALDPQGFFLATRFVQVCKPVDVMAFTVLLGAAQFTRLRQEALYHFTPMAVYSP